MLEKSVADESCRQVLEKRVVEKRVVEECCREVLEKSVVEKCWKRVLEN